MTATLSAASNPGIGAFTQHSKKKKGHRFSDPPRRNELSVMREHPEWWRKSRHGGYEYAPPVEGIEPPAPVFQRHRHAVSCRCPECACDMVERVLSVRVENRTPTVTDAIADAASNVELLATARDWWNAEPPVVAWSDGVRRPVTFAAYRDALLWEREASAHAEAAASATVPPVGAVTIRIRNAYEKPWQPEVPDTEDEQETAIMAAAVMAMPLDVQNVTEANQLFKQIEYALAAFVEAAGVEILA